MLRYKVTIGRQARSKIRERGKFIEAETGIKAIAQKYMKGVFEHCMSFSTFPRKNVRRDDLFPNLHITNYLGTTIIAYEIDDEARTVYVTDVFHSSQNYETSFTP